MFLGGFENLGGIVRHIFYSGGLLPKISVALWTKVPMGAG